MASTYTSQLRKTARHSAIYALGTIIRRITGFVMLPIYTRYLTPADYGVVELLTMAIEISGILIGLRISQAMFRYYILTEVAEEKKRVVSTVLLSVLFASCTGVLLLNAFSMPLNNIIFGGDEYILEFRLFTLTLITNAVSAVGLSYLRARQMPIVFVLVGIAMLALQVALNVYFVVILDWHVRGVVTSALISGSVLALSLSVFIVINTGIRFSFSLARSLIAYVAPLAVASLGAFYVAYADKYLLRVFGNLTDVGLYALAAKISSVLSTAYEAFNMSWAADRYEIVKRKDAVEIFGQMFRFVTILLVLVGSLIAYFSMDLFWIMTTPDYYPAAGVVPLLVLAVIPRLYTMYCNFGALLKERTGVMAVAAWINAIVATAGYLLLIPVLGMYGAAVSRILGNSIEFAWVYRKSAAHYDMRLPWSSVAGLYAVSIALGLVCHAMPQEGLQYFMLRGVVFFLLLACLVYMPVLKPEERTHAKTLFVQNFTRKLRRDSGR